MIGLRTAKRVVRRLLVNGQGSHAVLFYGAAGSGKHALARMLVQAWICQTPGPEGACGTCRACGAYLRGNAADFLVVRPQGNSRIIPNRAIAPPGEPDEPPPVLEFFRSLPLLGRHKVVLIEDADRMNSAAYNALLKTLEEPHPHAKLILTTPQIGAIPATILSRCLAIACETPTPEELKQAFPGAKPEEIGIAEGAPGRLHDVMNRRELYDAIIAFSLGLKRRSPREALAASDGLRKLGESIDDALKCGTRTANAEALALVATVLARDPESPPEWPQWIAEAHRRIVGNGSAAVVCDALFAKMLRKR